MCYNAWKVSKRTKQLNSHKSIYYERKRWMLDITSTWWYMTLSLTLRQRACRVKAPYTCWNPCSDEGLLILQKATNMFWFTCIQGQCGASYAFSAMGALEGAWSLAHGKTITLSEQNIIDCSCKIFLELHCTPFWSYLITTMVQVLFATLTHNCLCISLCVSILWKSWLPGWKHAQFLHVCDCKWWSGHIQLLPLQRKGR